MRDLLLVRNAPWLASGALLTLLSSFGQTIVISVCAADIQAEFSLSHGAWGGIYALGTTTSAVVMVWAGGLTDKFRVRSSRASGFVDAGHVLLVDGFQSLCMVVACRDFCPSFVWPRHDFSHSSGCNGPVV